MIVDRTDRFETYRCLSPLLGQALDWLRVNDDQADGRYEIDGDRLVAMVQGYTTQPAAERLWESHRRYVDLQVITAGVELIGYAPLGTLKVSSPYDAEKDVAFYAPPAQAETGTLIRADAGTAVLLGPHDVHQPGVQAGAAGAVRKVVFKLAADAVAI